MAFFRSVNFGDVLPAVSGNGVLLRMPVASDFPGFWRGPGGKVAPVATIEAGLGALGIANSTEVVLVPAGGDATEFGIVARAYWTLKYLGHDQVAILDGGWSAWVAEAPDSSESGPTKSVTAVFKAHVRPEFLASTGTVLDQLHSATVLVDARPLEQYLGRAKSPDATRFGHIPGALTLDSGLFYDTAAGRLKPKTALAALVPPQLADPGTSLIAYCNSGWWSATDWFVLHEMLGYRSAALYVESMAGWTADPSRPVETGGR